MRAQQDIRPRPRLEAAVISTLVIALFVSVTWHRAWASPTRMCRQALRTSRVAQSLRRERAQRLEWLAKLRSMASSLQRQPEGPARNFRLRAVLAEARDVAGRVKELDTKTTALRQSAQRMLAKMEHASKNLKGASRRRLLSCMARLRQVLPKPKPTSGHLANVVVRPDDGPAELRRKANLLADSADKLERRLRRLERVIHRTERQVALQRAAVRARHGGALVSSDQRRRAVATVTTTSRVQGRVPESSGHDGDQTLTVGGQGGHYDNNGIEGQGASTPASTPTRQTDTGALTQTWSSMLRAVHDLVDPAQAESLAKQAASSDPAVRLAALRRARKLLAESQRRLRARAKRLQAQARRLSGPRPGLARSPHPHSHQSRPRH